MTSTISNSTFHVGRDNILTLTQHTHNHYGIDPVATLRQRAALGALHDAAERPDPPKCHPETRTAVLDRIDQWMRDRSDGAKSILWLSGPAGAGKSAIAQTIVERWLDNGVVCLNFFFWRTSPKRNIKTHLIFTLAFQLVKRLPDIRSHIEAVIQDGSIFDQNLKTQVQQLIIDPISAVQATRKEGEFTVIVVDGLDECCVHLPQFEGFPGQTYEEQQREILEAITFACQKVSSLRVLVASRPERQIRISFSGPLRLLTLSLSLHNEVDADSDISIYLDCKFAEIRGQNEGIDPSWPSCDQISQLVNKASGQFIYPSTAVKYILRRRQHPIKSLDEVLSLEPRASAGQDHPLAELDALYTLILSVVATESWRIVKILLGLMCYAESPPADDSWKHGTGRPPWYTGDKPDLPRVFDFKSTQVYRDVYPLYFERLFLLEAGEINTHLVDLHSVLYINTARDPKTSERMHFFHATLSEYLQDKSRSGQFFLNKDDIYLQSTLYLVRHAAIHHELSKDPSTPEIEKSPYSTFWLLDSIATFLRYCPRSSELMDALMELLEKWMADPEDESDLFSFDVAAFCKQFDGGSFSPPYVKKELAHILKYLDKTNTPEFAPPNRPPSFTRRKLEGLWHVVSGDKGDQANAPSQSKQAITSLGVNSSNQSVTVKDKSQAAEETTVVNPPETTSVGKAKSNKSRNKKKKKASKRR